MCAKDKCCCPKKKKVAGKKRRGKVGKARLNASQIISMAAAPRLNAAVPLYTNNPLGEEQLTKKEKEPIVLLASPAPKALDISKKADKPDRKMKSMVSEALAPPKFTSAESPPQTIALKQREMISQSMNQPMSMNVAEENKKPMFYETRRSGISFPVTSTPFFKEARTSKRATRVVESGEGIYAMIQERGGAREGAGRPTLMSQMMSKFDMGQM